MLYYDILSYISYLTMFASMLDYWVLYSILSCHGKLYYIIILQFTRNISHTFVCYHIQCVYIDASSLGNCLVFGHCSLRECANSFIRVLGFVSWIPTRWSLSECDYIMFYIGLLWYIIVYCNLVVVLHDIILIMLYYVILS